jgi:hypothetical protein
MSRSTCACLVSLAFFVGTTMMAETGTAPSTHAAMVPYRVVLVELFTSEGCSDCPPADQLLRQIDGKTAAGTLMIGVSEHVTYWDRLGWKDAFSAEAMTQRQSGYGNRFALESVYTPQMVVNGEAQFVGGNGKALQEAVAKAKPVDVAALTIGGVKLVDDALEATVTLTGALPSRGVELFAVVAEDETTQHVLTGENKGRTLAHASVARTLVQVGKLRAAGDATVKLKLPPADEGTRRHLVVWAQEPGLGRVVGVGAQTF